MRKYCTYFFETNFTNDSFHSLHCRGTILDYFKSDRGFKETGWSKGKTKLRPMMCDVDETCEELAGKFGASSDIPPEKGIDWVHLRSLARAL